MRVRGWIPRDALLFGAPCVAGSGSFRQECTAQAHAIRKLGDMLNGFYRLGSATAAGKSVQWEVGGPNAELICPDQEDDTVCDPVTASGFRVDIMTTPSDEANGNATYGIAEVKRWDPNGSTPGVVNDQLVGYQTILEDDAGGLDLAIARENRLNVAKWAIRYFDTAGQLWYAWAPIPEDNIYGGANLNGHIYFAPSTETPNVVIARTAVQGDADYVQLIYHAYAAAMHILERWYPGIVPSIPSPLDPIIPGPIIVPGLPV